MSKVFGAPEQAKLKQLVKDGWQVMDEIKSLQEGLNDTIKAVAEELDVKPSVIKRAIKTAMKDDWEQTAKDFSDLEDIVHTTGHAGPWNQQVAPTAPRAPVQGKDDSDDSAPF
jgi:DNA-binding MarR family transcriptional regulator